MGIEACGTKKCRSKGCMQHGSQNRVGASAKLVDMLAQMFTAPDSSCSLADILTTLRAYPNAGNSVSVSITIASTINLIVSVHIVDMMEGSSYSAIENKPDPLNIISLQRLLACLSVSSNPYALLGEGFRIWKYFSASEEGMECMHRYLRHVFSGAVCCKTFSRVHYSHFFVDTLDTLLNFLCIYIATVRTAGQFDKAASLFKEFLTTAKKASSIATLLSHGLTCIAAQFRTLKRRNDENIELVSNCLCRLIAEFLTFIVCTASNADILRIRASGDAHNLLVGLFSGSVPALSAESDAFASIMASACLLSQNWDSIVALSALTIKHKYVQENLGLVQKIVFEDNVIERGLRSNLVSLGVAAHTTQHSVLVSEPGIKHTIFGELSHIKEVRRASLNDMLGLFAGSPDLRCFLSSQPLLSAFYWFMLVRFLVLDRDASSPGLSTSPNSGRSIESPANEYLRRLDDGSVPVLDPHIFVGRKSDLIRYVELLFFLDDSFSCPFLRATLLSPSLPYYIVYLHLLLLYVGKIKGDSIELFERDGYESYIKMHALLKITIPQLDFVRVFMLSPALSFDTVKDLEAVQFAPSLALPSYLLDASVAFSLAVVEYLLRHFTENQAPDEMMLGHATYSQSAVVEVAHKVEKFAQIMELALRPGRCYMEGTECSNGTISEQNLPQMEAYMKLLHQYDILPRIYDLFSMICMVLRVLPSSDPSEQQPSIPLQPQLRSAISRLVSACQALVLFLLQAASACTSNSLVGQILTYILRAHDCVRIPLRCPSLVFGLIRMSHCLSVAADTASAPSRRGEFEVRVLLLLSRILVRYSDTDPNVLPNDTAHCRVLLLNIIADMSLSIPELELALMNPLSLRDKGERRRESTFPPLAENASFNREAGMLHLFKSLDSDAFLYTVIGVRVLLFGAFSSEILYRPLVTDECGGSNPRAVDNDVFEIESDTSTESTQKPDSPVAQDPADLLLEKCSGASATQPPDDPYKYLLSCISGAATQENNAVDMQAMKALLSSVVTRIYPLQQSNNTPVLEPLLCLDIIATLLSSHSTDPHTLAASTNDGHSHAFFEFFRYASDLTKRLLARFIESTGHSGDKFEAALANDNDMYLSILALSFQLYDFITFTVTELCTATCKSSSTSLWNLVQNDAISNSVGRFTDFLRSALSCDDRLLDEWIGPMVLSMCALYSCSMQKLHATFHHPPHDSVVYLIADASVLVMLSEVLWDSKRNSQSLVKRSATTLHNIIRTMTADSLFLNTVCIYASVVSHADTLYEHDLYQCVTEALQIGSGDDLVAGFVRAVPALLSSFVWLKANANGGKRENHPFGHLYREVILAFDPPVLHSQPVFLPVDLTLLIMMDLLTSQLLRQNSASPSPSLNSIDRQVMALQRCGSSSSVMYIGNVVTSIMERCRSGNSLMYDAPTDSFSRLLAILRVVDRKPFQMLPHIPGSYACSQCGHTPAVADGTKTATLDYVLFKALDDNDVMLCALYSLALVSALVHGACNSHALTASVSVSGASFRLCSSTMGLLLRLLERLKYLLHHMLRGEFLFDRSQSISDLTTTNASSCLSASALRNALDIHPVSSVRVDSKICIVRATLSFLLANYFSMLYLQFWPSVRPVSKEGLADKCVDEWNDLTSVCLWYVATSVPASKGDYLQYLLSSFSVTFVEHVTRDPFARLTIPGSGHNVSPVTTFIVTYLQNINHLKGAGGLQSFRVNEGYHQRSTVTSQQQSVSRSTHKPSDDYLIADIVSANRMASILENLNSDNAIHKSGPGEEDLIIKIVVSVVYELATSYSSLHTSQAMIYAHAAGHILETKSLLGVLSSIDMICSSASENIFSSLLTSLYTVLSTVLTFSCELQSSSSCSYTPTGCFLPRLILSFLLLIFAVQCYAGYSFSARDALSVEVFPITLSVLKYADTYLLRFLGFSVGMGTYINCQGMQVQNRVVGIPLLNNFSTISPQDLTLSSMILMAATGLQQAINTLYSLSTQPLAPVPMPFASLGQERRRQGSGSSPYDSLLQSSREFFETSADGKMSLRKIAMLRVAVAFFISCFLRVDPTYMTAQEVVGSQPMFLIGEFPQLNQELQEEGVTSLTAVLLFYNQLYVSLHHQLFSYVSSQLGRTVTEQEKSGALTATILNHCLTVSDLSYQIRVLDAQFSHAKQVFLFRMYLNRQQCRFLYPNRVHAFAVDSYIYDVMPQIVECQKVLFHSVHTFEVASGQDTNIRTLLSSSTGKQVANEHLQDPRLALFRSSTTSDADSPADVTSQTLSSDEPGLHLTLKANVTMHAMETIIQYWADIIALVWATMPFHASLVAYFGILLQTPSTNAAAMKSVARRLYLPYSESLRVLPALLINQFSTLVFSQAIQDLFDVDSVCACHACADADTTLAEQRKTPWPDECTYVRRALLCNKLSGATESFLQLLALAYRIEKMYIAALSCLLVESGVRQLEHSTTLIASLITKIATKAKLRRPMDLLTFSLLNDFLQIDYFSSGERLKANLLKNLSFTFKTAYFDDFYPCCRESFDAMFSNYRYYNVFKKLQTFKDPISDCKEISCTSGQHTFSYNRVYSQSGPKSIRQYILISNYKHLWNDNERISYVSYGTMFYGLFNSIRDSHPVLKEHLAIIGTYSISLCHAATVIHVNTHAVTEERTLASRCFKRDERAQYTHASIAADEVVNIHWSDERTACSISFWYMWVSMLFCRYRGLLKEFAAPHDNENAERECVQTTQRALVAMSPVETENMVFEQSHIRGNVFTAKKQQDFVATSLSLVRATQSIPQSSTQAEAPESRCIIPYRARSQYFRWTKDCHHVGSFSLVCTDIDFLIHCSLVERNVFVYVLAKNLLEPYILSEGIATKHPVRYYISLFKEAFRQNKELVFNFLFRYLMTMKVTGITHNDLSNYRDMIVSISDYLDT